jgi:hypothetical protein
MIGAISLIRIWQNLYFLVHLRYKNLQDELQLI